MKGILHQQLKPGLIKLEKSNWKTILEYVSKKSIGDLITRKELVDLLYDPHVIGLHSVDASRILLTRVGVLEIQKRGVYIKKRNIKPSWSMFKLANISNNWRGWYMKLD